MHSSSRPKIEKACFQCSLTPHKSFAEMAEMAEMTFDNITNFAYDIDGDVLQMTSMA